ncbi:IS3 family transposase [Streptomyces sp. NBC_00161]|uniref:IS3 family transposase n=1 Tax=Streptomyces sp. NBC_00161 TaxID=2975671 RepID=UPI0032530916
MNRCQFVQDHQRRFGVKRLCDILGISRSSFCYWRRTAAARAVRQIAEAKLVARIRTVHQECDGTYGAPRITAELRDKDPCYWLARPAQSCPDLSATARCVRTLTAAAVSRRSPSQA